MPFDITIKEYLKEIDESPLLSWEEEKSLAYAILENNDPEARDHLGRITASSLRDGAMDSQARTPRDRPIACCPGAVDSSESPSRTPGPRSRR